MNEENLNGLGLKIHFNFVYVKTETGYSDTFTQGCRVKLLDFFIKEFLHDIQEYRSRMQTVKLKIVQPLVHHELVI